MMHSFDGLVSDGYSVFIDAQDRDRLIHECRSLGIVKGGIGDDMLDQSIRRDKTCWLSPEQGPAIKAYLDAADVLRRALNEALFLNLTGFECHYALFETGSFYRRHIDNIQGRSNRVVTYILYLNDAWEKGDGGELCFEDGLLMEPSMGNSILFMSSEVSHEVLEANRPRMSISGWFTRT